MPDRRISGSFTGSSFAYLVSALAHNAMEEIAPAKVADKLDRIANRVRLEGDIKPSSQYTIERRDDGVDFVTATIAYLLPCTMPLATSICFRIWIRQPNTCELNYGKTITNEQIRY